MMPVVHINFTRYLSVVVLFTALNVFTNAAHAGVQDGIDLLKKMSLTQDEIDYTGEFIVVKDGKITSFKITHLSTDIGSQQKLISLDGSMREIIQSDGVIACVLPDQGMGIREKKQRKQLFKSNISSNIKDIERHYNVAYLGSKRVANRNCEQVKVSPKDQFRYGYLLCIDSEKYLLLRSELTNQQDEILESYMFTHVQFDRIDTDAFVSNIAPQSLQWIEDGPMENEKDNANAGVKKWQLEDNDSGFVLEHYINRLSPVIQTNITHLVLGDGMANVSVFISPLKSSASKQNYALTLGSLSSFSRKSDEHMITVIGEVPQATVALIAAHIYR